MDPYLELAAAEVESFVAQAGWDQRPTVFALVRSAQFVRDEPQTAAQLGIDPTSEQTLTPIEQDELPEGELDEALARIGWPESVAGCALSQEIVILPPSADDTVDSPAAAAAHPDRREARLVVAVLRDGSSATLLRLRPVDEDEDELLSGEDLAPNLVEALLATLRD